MFSLFSRALSAGANQLAGLISTIPPRLLGTQPVVTGVVNTSVPVRGKSFDHHFINRWMARDYKRRTLVRKHFPARLRYIAIKRCSVLPKEFQEIAAEELHAFPRDACFVRLKPRCILTSRPRWVIHSHRLSRIQWRLLADYNKLSGVMRATW